MAGSIEELLDLLYTEIEEAKNAPLSNDRCVIERDRVLDMIDDVKAELPVEIKRPKTWWPTRTTMWPPPSGRQMTSATRRRTMPSAW